MKLRWNAVLAFFLCILLLPISCSCSKGEDSLSGKSFRWSLSREPKTLDPQIASGEDAYTVILALYEGLARIAGDGDMQRAVPGAAESWEHNEDYTVWTFYLREGGLWSDGETPVTASDFQFAFQRALDPGTGSETCTPLYCIRNARDVHSGKKTVDELGVTVKDDYTLVVELEYSNENFPLLTALPVCMPCNEEFFISTSGRYGLEKSTLMGNGPFEIDGRYGWEAGKHINVKASGTYSGETEPLPSDISFTVGEKEVDLSSPVSALTSGTVDAIALTEAEAQEAEKSGSTTVSFEDTVWGLCFNLEDKALKNADLRRFFLRSIDREKLLEQLPSGVKAADGIISPAVTLEGSYYRDMAGSITFPQKASEKELAGWLQSGISDLSLEQAPTFTIIYPKDQNIGTLVNEILKTWNESTGLYYNMEPLEEEEYNQRISLGDFSAAIYALRPDSDGAYSTLSAFQSKSAGNIFGYSSSEFDTLLDEIARHSGEDAVNLSLQAENMLLEDCVFLPLYTGKHFYGMAPGVTGIRFLPYGGGVDFIAAGKK